MGNLPPDSPHPPKSQSRNNGHVPARKEHPLSAVRHVAELFKLASEPMRIQLLMILVECDRSVASLFEQLVDVEPGIITRHLGILRRTGLIESRVAGQSRIYSATEAGRQLAGIIDMLGED